MEDAKMKEKMEDLKTKAKSFMKNFSSPFGAARGGSSGGGGPQVFMGQGHRLGGGGEPAYGAPVRSERGCGGRRMGPGQPDDLRRLQQEKWERERGLAPAQNSSNPGHGAGSRAIQAGGSVASAAASVKSPAPDDRVRVEREARSTVQVGTMAPPEYSSWAKSAPAPASHFDPYSTVIASGTSHRPSVRPVSRAAEPASGQFQCPICEKRWQSEAQVSAHLDDGCTGVAEEPLEFAGLSIAERQPSHGAGRPAEDLDEAVTAFLSGGPAMATVELMLKVFRNILSAPSEEKFRKLRLENPRIKESIGSAIGGLRFLEIVGFRYVVEGQERFSLMDPPSIEQQERLQAAIAYLDSYQSASVASSRASDSPAETLPKACNRQMRIFYASNDHLVERFELPESFFRLSTSEVKNEVAARRKKLEDGQVLIPKSFREKQAANARRRYKITVVRIRLPDGLVVQGYFKPGEPTTALYEFASSILKDSSETFDLVLPGATRHRVIPRFPDERGHCLTLDEAELVPKALIKFVATSPQGYTCLRSECYDLCEPLTSSTVLEPSRG